MSEEIVKIIMTLGKFKQTDGMYEWLKKCYFITKKPN